MRSVLLDTSFLIRFLNDSDKLFKNAEGYYKYFLKEKISMKCSTISVAEYCVRGSIDELPLKDVQLLPFNLPHSIKAGEFSRILFENKEKLNPSVRAIIPNDAKLFAQADVEETIDAFVTSDEECIKMYNLLKKEGEAKFQLYNLRTKCNEAFGFLDLE